MSTLLLRLAAPLQSWGYDSRFETRNTGREPTKSGVVGMLAASLGRKRNDNVSDLNSLRFGVRADREGKMLRDFHTVKSEKAAYITYRYYLSDAVFLVGLESENTEFLKMLEDAIQNPAFPLFLGRRSCPPTPPIFLKISDCDLMTALCTEKCLVKGTNCSDKLRIQYDSFGTGNCMKQDCAVSFNPAKRVYGYRKIEEKYVCPNCETTHDAMSELR